MERKVHTLKSGGRLHYLDTGSGDVLLFVHGIWANHHLWKGVIDALRVAPWLASPLLGRLMSPGASVFVPLDAPERVAAEIAAFVRDDDQRPVPSPP